MAVGVMSVFVLLVLLVAVLALAATAFWIWMLVDVLRRPDQQFAAAGQNKVLWVLVVAFGHLLGALIYLFVARQELDRVAFHRY
jgi:hypothetical protein